jgi:hypothetical protein
MTKRLAIAAVFVVALAAVTAVVVPQAAAQARLNYRVTIYNLTNDQVFSPPLVVTHKPEVAVFHPGHAASPALRMLAEDGASDPLRLELSLSPDVMSIIAATAPIPPGGSASYEVSAQGSFDRLSALGMLVTTNDAFFALDSFEIAADAFRNRSEVLAYAPAYDAGTENNNELCGFIPGPPCGNGGVPDVAGAEGYVHIHRGIHGVGDLDAARFDWRNPVAKIVITKLR